MIATEPFPNPIEEPTITVERAGRLHGLGRTASYSAAARGEIPTIRVGRRIVVPTAILAARLGIEFPPAA